MSVVSHLLFETHNVVAFKIPPGKISVSNWSKDSIVWKGSLRLLEQETVIEENAAPYMGLRLKLELFNKEKLTLLLEDFTEVDNDVQWAEVWYNPRDEGAPGFCVANDGEETIEITESPKYYKIITQLPKTGYHPLEGESKGSTLQVALGIKFEDSFSAVSFAESLGIYRRRYRTLEEKFHYDKHLLTLQQRIRNGLGVSDDEKESTPASDFDDDDFGNFVGSSYD